MDFFFTMGAARLYFILNYKLRLLKYKQNILLLCCPTFYKINKSQTRNLTNSGYKKMGDSKNFRSYKVGFGESP